LLGTREPQVYGSETLAAIDRRLASLAQSRAALVESFQSNHEGVLIDRIHAARVDEISAIVINPGGFTHSSVSLRDALAAVAIPFIEVHLSNVHAREPFRRRSLFSDIAVGSIVGLGSRGYDLALAFFLDQP